MIFIFVLAQPWGGILQQIQVMQAFLADLLNHTSSTSAALQLLKHSETVLQRDSLKADLAKMYKVQMKTSCSLKILHCLSTPTLVRLAMQYCSTPLWYVSKNA